MMDLEGIVGKWKDAPYGTEPSSWTKIKNPAYSQAEGRRERFQRMATADDFRGRTSATPKDLRAQDILFEALLFPLQRLLDCTPQ
jgi:hypothetical protein